VDAWLGGGAGCASARGPSTWLPGVREWGVREWRLREWQVRKWRVREYRVPLCHSALDPTTRRHRAKYGLADPRTRGLADSRTRRARARARARW